jgi:hypothetical protein
VMAVTFELKPKAYACMLTKVPVQSSAYVCLKTAKPSDYESDGVQPAYYEVRCSLDDAAVLHHAATQHCPEAVGAIVRAIRISLGQSS